MDGVDSIRAVLRERLIHLDKLHDDTGIFDHADAFVKLSRDNQTVEKVTLYLNTDPDAHQYAIWDKVAEGIGNLQALRAIIISHTDNMDGEGDPLFPNWEILACILRRLRRGIHLRMQDGVLNLWDTDALPSAFARAIHGHAMITRFSTGNTFHFHCFDDLCSVLLTLPALENVSFQHDEDGEGGPEEGQSFESMVKLLNSPTLRELKFKYVDFTNLLCQAVAKALQERSEITNMHFDGYCSFPEGGGAVIARALKTNTTLKYLYFDEGYLYFNELVDECFCEVLAAVLLSNSTLQNLYLSAPDDSGYNTGSCSWLSPSFLALQVNSGVKELSIHGIHLIDEKLSTAMRLGLGKNSTLETLKLTNIKSGDNDTCLWLEALSFLRTNTTLKTLHMDFDDGVTESHATAIRMEIAATLCENESLETLVMPSEGAKLEDYLVFVPAIQPNTTLKKLRLHNKDFSLEGDEIKDFIAVLKKNYGLEEIRGLQQCAGDIRSIFDLNGAGRRYLVQDGSSISKGVHVLSRVNNDINSVFLHLLENPRLCDRSAVEMSSSIRNIDNARSTPSPGNYSGGKREQQASLHTGTETRRRLE
jgi:hypothetical protein